MMGSSHPVWEPRCCICAGRTPLETSKVDEFGRAVHEDCYVSRLVPNSDTASADQQLFQFQPRAWSNSAIWGTLPQATGIPGRVNRRSLRLPRWSVDVAAVLAVLALACCVAYTDRRHSSVVGSSGSVLPTKLQSASMSLEASKTEKVAFKRVRIGENEVDYIAEDVIIRRFTQKNESALGRASYKQVDRGDDVTTRYFGPTPTVAPDVRSTDPKL